MAAKTNEYMRANREHAQYVKTLLGKGTKYSGDTEGFQTAITDLLADIRHFCDIEGLSFADADKSAHNHYSCEVVEAETGQPQ